MMPPLPPARLALVATLLTGLAGCGDDTVTILPAAPASEAEARTRVERARHRSEIIAAQESANLAGLRVSPRNPNAERVEAEERANLALTPR